MKRVVRYCLLGLTIYYIVEFLAINLGHMIGAGQYEIGIVVSAISVLCAIVVICTIIIVDAIKGINSKDN